MTRLKVGQRVKDEAGNEWELLSFNPSETELRLKVHGCDSMLLRYLNQGAEYTAMRMPTSDTYEVWEISPAQMKRSVSQVLLYVEDGMAVIDLDM